MSEFSMRSVGTVRSPFTETSQIPRGPGADHYLSSVPAEALRRGWLAEAEARRAAEARD